MSQVTIIKTMYLYLYSSTPSAAYSVSESGQQCFRYWPVAYSAPNHYLNQCWVIVNWALRNKLQWNFNQNTILFIHENASKKYRLRNGGHFVQGRWVNSLWRCEATWRQRSCSALVHTINSLSIVRHQTSTWINLVLLSIGSPGTNFSIHVISIIQQFSFVKIHFKMSARCLPFRRDLDVLTVDSHIVNYSNDNKQFLFWNILF